MNKVIALGFFDSIHVGHRLLLKKAKEKATSINAELLVATFGDNFFNALGKENEEIFLLQERKFLLKNIGIDDVIIFPDNKNFLSKNKYQFLEYLATFSPAVLVCGNDYRFGKNAEGKIDDLMDFFAKKGVEIIVVPLLCDNGRKISSSMIREYLRNGRIELANEHLGARFFYSGTVTKGRCDGKKMGYPTVNIDVIYPKIKIKQGVYVTYATIKNKRYLSVTNVGSHPTFFDEKYNVETYVLGDIGEVYGEEIRVEFYKYVRPIQKFSSVVELTERIAKDVEYAKEVNND